MDTGMDHVIRNPYEEGREQETGLAKVTIPQISGKQVGIILQKFKSSQITMTNMKMYMTMCKCNLER